MPDALGSANKVGEALTHGLTLELLAARIRLYLARQPRAADTLRGVIEAWLSDIRPPPSPDDVLAVLLQLEADGAVERIELLDGGQLWRAAR
jgi:hypothetical protein